LPGEPKRLDHPRTAYVLGFIFVVITLAVLAGVLHHLTLSHHGPELLKPILGKYSEKDKSDILDEVRRQEELEVHNHFHHIVEYPRLPESERSVCFICHSDYPHSNKKRVRSLLNMHTQYFVCEACHIKEKPDTLIFYKWHSPFEDNPRGPFPGTRYDADTGNLVEVEDKFSKITPFFIKGVTPESALQNQDAPLARDYMKVRDKLTPEQREGVKNKFHVNIKPKGYDCQKCHTKNGVLDFKRLGFTDKRIKDLEQLNITGMLTKYEVFYLPELLKE